MLSFSLEGELWPPQMLRRSPKAHCFVDKGGHFEVRQAEVVPGHWDMTTMNLEMTGRALLFKSIEVQKKENRRDFHQVSDDLTLTQAADLLNKHTVDNR